MKYSILNSGTKQRLTLGNEIENSYIDWEIDKTLVHAFKEYRQSYQVTNDISIFDISYFSILCDLFYESNFSFKGFDFSLAMENFEDKIFTHRFNFYQNKYMANDISVSEFFDDIDDLNESDSIISPDSDKTLDSLKNLVSLSSLKQEPEEVFFLDEDIDFETLTEDFYSKCRELANKDIKQFESYKSEILDKNPLILMEFKNFVIGFHDYMVQIIPEQYSKFKTYFNILEEDMQFFKRTQIHSLSKYKFVIGVSTKRNSGSRGKTDDFIPAGTCYYGEKVFMNSDNMNKRHGAVWFKRSIKRVFYHEVGHALDYLYFDEVVLKDGIERERSSHNEEFLKICKKNYSKFRFFKSYLPKKYASWLSYYIAPVISVKKINSLEIIPEVDAFSQKLSTDFHDIFSDVIPLPQIIHKAPVQKKFSSKINMSNHVLDFSKPLSESWAESFSFVFAWIKDGFSEYDKFAIKAGRSHDRALIKMQHDCMLYILENFDWSKLNISYSVYLKRKTHIKKYLKHIKDMPLFIGKKKNKEARRKVYLTYRDLLRHR